MLWMFNLLQLPVGARQWEGGVLDILWVTTVGRKKGGVLDVLWVTTVGEGGRNVVLTVGEKRKHYKPRKVKQDNSQHNAINVSENIISSLRLRKLHVASILCGTIFETIRALKISSNTQRTPGYDNTVIEFIWPRLRYYFSRCWRVRVFPYRSFPPTLEARHAKTACYSFPLQLVANLNVFIHAVVRTCIKGENANQFSANLKSCE